MVLTSMRITRKTLERLRELGIKGESYEEVINRILDDLDNYLKLKKKNDN